MYADVEFYEDIYKGIEVSDEDLLTLYLERSSQDIDLMVSFDFDSLRNKQQDYIKLANCIMAENYYINGGVTSAADFSSVSLGGFSISVKDGDKTTRFLPERAKLFLIKAGVFDRSVISC